MKRDASVRHLRWTGFECQAKAGLFQDKRLVRFAITSRPSKVPDTGVALHFTSGKRGSVSFQVDFSHTWFGSSVTASVREVPARKFR